MIPPCRLLAYRGELPRPLYVRGDALVRRRGPLARGLDRLVAEQRRAKLRRNALPCARIRREQPLERLGRNAVVEVVPFHALLQPDRLVDPGARPACRSAHM